MYKNVSYSYTIVLILLFLSCFTPKTFANQLATTNHPSFFVENDNKDLVIPVFNSPLTENTHFVPNSRFIHDQIDTSFTMYMPGDHELVQVNPLLHFV